MLAKTTKKIAEQHFFVLYSPKRIKLRPGDFINVDMKLSVRLTEQIIAASVLLPTSNNICNASQPINLPSKVHFELVNRSTNIVFSICKRQGFCFLITFKDGAEELKVKYTKTKNTNY